MPLREYKCLNCNFVFEKLYKINEKYPEYQDCPNCNGELMSEIQVANCAMHPDKLWHGHEIKSLGLKNVTSKSYLKRYMKTEGITQLTEEENKTIKRKSKKEIVVENLNKPDIVKQRREELSKSLDGFGVIDGVK